VAPDGLNVGAGGSLARSHWFHYPILCPDGDVKMGYRYRRELFSGRSPNRVQEDILLDILFQRPCNLLLAGMDRNSWADTKLRYGSPLWGDELADLRGTGGYSSPNPADN